MEKERGNLGLGLKRFHGILRQPPSVLLGSFSSPQPRDTNPSERVGVSAPAEREEEVGVRVVGGTAGGTSSALFTTFGRQLAVRIDLVLCSSSVLAAYNGFI
jgi:hypothetical protein